MNDDRTEAALRRALDDAARQVEPSPGALPEPSLVRRATRRSTDSMDRPRGPLAVAAGIAAVAVLVAGSVALIGGDDDGTPSIGIGQAVDGDPITTSDADVVVTLVDEASSDQIDEVRAFLDQSADVAAYAYIGSDVVAAERVAQLRCGSPVPIDSAGIVGPTFLIRLSPEAAAIDLARLLIGEPVVRQVWLNPNAADATPTTPTTEPAGTEPPTAAETTSPLTTATTQPPATETEVPYVPRIPEECADDDSGHAVQTTPMQPTVATPPTVALPPPGEQPADPVAAEQAVREMWIATHSYSAGEDKFAGRLEDYDELIPLVERAGVGHESITRTLGVRILAIQFVSPTRAAVLFHLTFGASADMVDLQYAVLIDGTWMIERESMCRALTRANVHCPEGP